MLAPDVPPVLRHTPLHALHLELGGRMVPFAGTALPLQYRDGVLKEHLWVRSRCGLFDVSHLGQIVLRPKSGRLADAAIALERLVPQDIVAIAPQRQRYGQFTTDSGGILDDLMVANCGDHLFLVVNASTRDADAAHLAQHLGSDCSIEVLTDRALIALQGPQAETVLAKFCNDVETMRFMDVRHLSLAGSDCIVSRSGYTGEDGFEISVPAGEAEGLARALLADDDVRPIGLGARDSLRLEAALCLAGDDIDPGTTVVEAALQWSIQASRRSGGARAGGFPGAMVILDQLANGAPRCRVGLALDGRAPLRKGAVLFTDTTSDQPVGTVTSGGFAPSLNAPIAMGYVEAALSAPETRLFALQRGQHLAVRVTRMPFFTSTSRR